MLLHMSLNKDTYSRDVFNEIDFFYLEVNGLFVRYRYNVAQ